MKDPGLKIGAIAGLLMVIGGIGVVYSRITGCEIADISCADTDFLLPFGGMFLIGIVLLFVGVRINKKELIK